MLGLAPLSTRSISGGPFSLVAVALQAAASGALITISGTAQPGAYIPIRATGSALAFGGTAAIHWTQTIAGTGPVITFGGDALLRLAGKPLKITALRDSFRITAQSDRLILSTLAQPYSMKGYS